MTDIETRMEAEAQGADAEYERTLEAEADSALTRIADRQSWKDWLKVGELFCHGRRQAMLYTHTNKPEGKGYILWFSGWMERHPKLRLVDKATRNHAMQCFDNAPAIEQWRKTLAENQLQSINHPTTVLRRWKKEHSGEEAAATVLRKQSKAAELAEQISVRDGEIAKLKAKIEKGGENLFALSDTARNIAVTLAGNLSTSKLAELAKELGVELAKRRRMEADKKRAGPK